MKLTALVLEFLDFLKTGSDRIFCNPASFAKFCLLNSIKPDQESLEQISTLSEAALLEWTMEFGTPNSKQALFSKMMDKHLGYRGEESHVVQVPLQVNLLLEKSEVSNVIPQSSASSVEEEFESTLSKLTEAQKD